MPNTQNKPDAFDVLIADLVRGAEVDEVRIDEALVPRGLTMTDVRRACDSLDAALPRLAGMLRRTGLTGPLA